MRRSWRWQFLAASACLVGLQGSALAQYPGGYGGFGWHGWGGLGASTVGGDLAHGMGAFMMGAGQYNEQTAVANSIDADTIMRFNEYLYQSQQEANRQRDIREARRAQRTKEAHQTIQTRLRDNPTRQDVESGSALNVAVDEITNPRVFGKDIKSARVAIGGETVRNIPFQYSRGGITTSISQLTTGELPKALLAPEFESDRNEIKALGAKVREELLDGGEPKPETITNLLKEINELRDKASKSLPKNSSEQVQSERFLKALHGLVDMLRTPAIDVLLAGVEKRPDVTIEQLLSFMNAFNLRFGQATTPEQRKVYQELYSKLATVRTEVRAALASAAPVKTTGHEPEEFFSAMSYEDLEKASPKPPAKK